MKKLKYLKSKVKGNYKHIGDIEKDLFINFWDLMETVNHHYEVEDNDYINIIDDLVNLGSATVGDYCITLDNRDADNLDLLNEAKKSI